MKRFFIFILAFAVLSFTAFTALAQDTQSKGSIKGSVTDPNGAVVTGATVTVTGPTGDRQNGWRESLGWTLLCGSWANRTTWSV